MQEERDRLGTHRFEWYVLTAAGEAGPYPREWDARLAAKASGWVVIRREVRKERGER